MPTMRHNVMRLMMTTSHNDELPYLCFTANADNSSVRLNKVGTGTFNTISLQYSVDNGKTWSNYEWENDLSDLMLGDLITLAYAGDKVYFKAPNGTPNNNFNKSDSYYNFVMSGSISASGNIMSLVSDSMPDVIPSSYFFSRLFVNCTSLESAPLLPATNMSTACYYRMFYGCTSLISVSELPATISKSNCYEEMFRGCTSLISAPLLPATDMSTACYRQMFYGCTSLISVSELPATISKSRCYEGMFYGCTRLTGIVEINFKTTVDNNRELKSMFNACSSLDGIKVHFTSWDNSSGTDNTTYNWVNGVTDTSDKKFYCPASLPDERGVNRIPSNWTIKKEGYYNNGKFYNDAELTTESTLTAGAYYIDIPTEIEYYYDGSSLIQQ